MPKRSHAAGRRIGERPAVPTPRRVDFYVVAWALSILLGLLFVATTILTLTLWFAGQDSSTNPVTDLGFFALGGLVIVPGLVVQLRAPQRRLAGMQQALIGTFVLSLAGLVGARIEPLVGGLIFFLAVLLLARLHPARAELTRRPKHVSIPLLGLSAIAAIPAAGYAARMLDSARNAGASCFFGRCAHGDRFAELAALAITVVLVGLLAALKTRGWMLSALSAAAAAIVLGLMSIALPDVAGSPGPRWGGAAVAWGVLFVLIAWREIQRGRASMEGTVA